MSNLIDVTFFIMKGSEITIKLFLITLLVSLPVGMLVSLGKISSIKPLKIFLSLYTWIFRGTPLLLQLFFFYFALPIINIRLQPLTAASLAFIINYAAYFGEIFRGGITSVDEGQLEAAKAIGMTYRQSMTRIILPQAFRTSLPAVCNESTSLLKDTALVAAIGMGDLLRGAKEVVTRDFTIYPFAIVAVMYLCLVLVIVLFFKNLEKRYSAYI